MEHTYPKYLLKTLADDYKKQGLGLLPDKDKQGQVGEVAQQALPDLGSENMVPSPLGCLGVVLVFGIPIGYFGGSFFGIIWALKDLAPANRQWIGPIGVAVCGTWFTAGCVAALAFHAWKGNNSPAR